MKSLINIVGGILLVVVLLSKKKETPNNPVIPIIPDIPEIPPLLSRVQPVTNASLSPTLTTYEISDTEKIINLLTRDSVDNILK